MAGEQNNSNILLTMVMLKSISPLNFDEFVKDIKENGSYVIDDITPYQEGVSVFDIEKATVSLMYMDFAIPWGDIEGTAPYAYNWRKAKADLKDHQAHIVISLSSKDDNTITSFKMLTEVVCSILKTHDDAIGVYNGEQSLLIPKDQYLGVVNVRGKNSLPLNLWVYFGLRVIEGKTFGYTYGLKAFGKKEMEILNSERELEDIRAFLYNLAHYVLDTHVEFKAGETCGFSADEKIAITLSPGNFVKGDSFKLAY